MKKTYPDRSHRDNDNEDPVTQPKQHQTNRRGTQNDQNNEYRNNLHVSPEFTQKISMAASQNIRANGQQPHSSNNMHQHFVTTNTSRSPATLQVPGTKDGQTGRFHDTGSASISDMTIPGEGGDKKHGRWTQHEKGLFIDALRIHGKDWKKVEQHIKTRSGAQIRSHAQKFFQNAEKTKGMDIDQYIQYLQQQHGTGPVAVPPTSTGQITPTMSIAAGMAPSQGPTSQYNAIQGQEISQNADNLSSSRDHTKFKVKKEPKAKRKDNHDGNQINSDEDVSDLSGLSGAGASSKVSLTGKMINQMAQSRQQGKSPSITKTQLMTMRNQNISQQSGSQSQQNALTYLLRDYFQHNGGPDKLRLSPSKMQSRREDVNNRHQNGDSRSNSFMRESPQTVGKTPSFGGLALNQINNAMFGQDEQFMGLHSISSKIKRKKDELSRAGAHQQNARQFGIQGSPGYGGKQTSAGPGLATQNYSCQQNNQQSSLALHGLANAGDHAGLQGRDRAYSSQSGVPFPSLQKQENQQQVQLLQKLLANKAHYKPSPQTQQKKIVSDIIKKHPMLSGQGKAQTNQDQEKSVYPPSLQKNSSKRDIVNLLKPLLEQKNSSLSRGSDRAASRYHGKGSPEAPRGNIYPNLQHMITQLGKTKSYDDRDQSQRQTDKNLQNMLKQFQQKRQEKLKLSGVATPQSHNQIDEMSGANTEQGKNALFHQILKVLQQGKNVQLGPRGVSEISRQSRTSKQAFTTILKQPQPVIGQRVSGESHSSLANQRALHKKNMLINKQIKSNNNIFQNNQLQAEQNNHEDVEFNEDIVDLKNVARDDSIESENSRDPKRQQIPRFDNSKKIKNLELRIQSLNLNLINDMHSNMTRVDDQDTSELVQKYQDAYNQIQGSFLKLYNKEMKYHANLQKQQNQRVTRNPEQKTAKNFINHDIIKNMIQILNNQVFMNIIIHLINSKQPQEYKKFNDMSPINLKIFKQLIPLSYHESLREKLIKINEDELQYQLNKSNSSIESSPEENRQKSKIVDAQEDFAHHEGAKMEASQLSPRTNNVRPGDQQPQEEDARDQEEKIYNYFGNNENDQELPSTLNPINPNTFQQIAQSLSPEPDRLLKQKAHVDQEVKHGAVGQKRHLPQDQANDEYEELCRSDKRQKLEQMAYDTPDKGNSRAMQRQQISSTSFGLKPNAVQGQYKEIGMPTVVPPNVCGNQGDLGLDVDQIIHGLLQQYQESQIGASTAGGCGHAPPQNAAVNSPSRVGVRVGGTRQAAYSDSHQELVDKIEGVCPENAQMMAQTGQKGKIKTSLEELQMIQNLGTAINNHNQHQQESNQQKEVLEQQLLLHLQNSSPAFIQQLQQSMLQEQEMNNQDEDLLAADDTNGIRQEPGQRQGGKVYREGEEPDENSLENRAGKQHKNDLMNPESPVEENAKPNTKQGERNVALGLEGHKTTAAMGVASTEVARNLAVSPRKSSPSKLSPRKSRSGTKIANQKSQDKASQQESPLKLSGRNSSAKKENRSPLKSNTSKASNKQQ